MTTLSPWPPLWPTRDRWLQYGGRHRWTRSLNLPLYRAPLTPAIFNNIDRVVPLRVCGCLKFVHLHSCLLSGLRPCTQYPISVRLWDEETDRPSYPEFPDAPVHTFSGADPRRRRRKGGLSTLLISTHVSQRSGGWEWADGTRTGGEDEAVERVKKVITEGRLHRKWRRGRRMIDFFFLCSRAFSDTHTPLSVLSPRLRLFSITPSAASWSPSSSPIICSVPSCISFHLSYHFALHLLQLWLENTEHQWSNLIPIHILQCTLSPRPPRHPAPSPPPLLFTSLFHTFCLAFKSSFYLSHSLACCKKSWHGITSERLGKLFRASHGAAFPRRNYCWNKQLWEVSALVDPSLLTISQPLSAIAKTLSHRGAVMIALLSWGRKTGGKKEDDQRKGAVCNWRLFITVREVAPQPKLLNWKSVSNQKPLKSAKQPSRFPWWFDTPQLQVQNFKSIALTLPCEACFCWGGVRRSAPCLLSTAHCSWPSDRVVNTLFCSVAYFP